MDTGEKTKRYKTVQDGTVKQEKIILMLYDASMKYLTTALDALDEKRFDVVNDNLVRVQRIITELMVSIDVTVGEIAMYLFSYYQHIYDKLLEANVKKIAPPIKEAMDLLISLREVWVKVCAASPVVKTPLESEIPEKAGESLSSDLPSGSNDSPPPDVAAYNGKSPTDKGNSPTGDKSPSSSGFDFIG